MTWGFEVGRVYNRRTEIHPVLGGNQQSGISYAADGNTVFFVTGSEGKKYGYEDRWRPDGVFEYCGEGSTGDQTLTKGNRQIADHLRNGKQLLMFSKIAEGSLRFDGEMICQSYFRRPIRDMEGNTRSGIIFELRSIEAVQESVDAELPDLSVPLDVLRERAMAAVSIPANDTKSGTRTVYKRSQDVRDYVLARAKGSCEGCGHDAPFKRPNGTPYLEPHHIRRVSDGGPDDPRFVIALCPNCHRRVHAGADGDTFNGTLLAKMATIEP